MFQYEDITLYDSNFGKSKYLIGLMLIHPNGSAQFLASQWLRFPQAAVSGGVGARQGRVISYLLAPTHGTVAP